MAGNITAIPGILSRQILCRIMYNVIDGKSLGSDESRLAYCVIQASLAEICWRCKVFPIFAKQISYLQ